MVFKHTHTRSSECVSTEVTAQPWSEFGDVGLLCLCLAWDWIWLGSQASPVCWTSPLNVMIPTSPAC